MARKILIKLTAVIVVLSIAHSVFWFFKAGQLEKSINHLVSKNSANLNIGSFDVSGFPFFQKITIRDLKFSIPSSALNKNKVLVKKIEATSSVFKNDFNIEVVGDVIVFDKNGRINNVDLKSAPRANLVISGSMISKFSYSDEGYKVITPEQQVIYSTDSSNIEYKTTSQDGKINAKVDIKVNQMLGLDIIDIYQNSFEKKVIDGIKTGSIKLSENSSEEEIIVEKICDETISDCELEEKQEMVDDEKSVKEVGNSNELVKTVTVASSKEAQKVVISSEDEAQKPIEAEPVEVLQVINVEENQDIAITPTDIVIDLEYSLSDQNDLKIKLPFESSEKAEEKNNVKSFQINNIAFKNQFYQIMINGKVDYYQDDSMPSGYATIKVEKISNLIKLVKERLEEVAGDNSSKLQSFDASYGANISQDSYSELLKKIALRLDKVVVEIANKNQLTTDDAAIFDVRRERNLDLIINDAAIREILGKF
jgi:hypothetical protein